MRFIDLFFLGSKFAVDIFSYIKKAVNPKVTVYLNEFYIPVEKNCPAFERLLLPECKIIIILIIIIIIFIVTIIIIIIIVISDAVVQIVGQYLFAQEFAKNLIDSKVKPMTFFMVYCVPFFVLGRSCKI